jgi:hypothetical protein
VASTCWLPPQQTSALPAGAPAAASPDATRRSSRPSCPSSCPSLLLSPCSPSALSPFADGNLGVRVKPATLMAPTPRQNPFDRTDSHVARRPTRHKQTTLPVHPRRHHSGPSTYASHAPTDRSSTPRPAPHARCPIMGGVLILVRPICNISFTLRSGSLALPIRAQSLLGSHQPPAETGIHPVANGFLRVSWLTPFAWRLPAPPATYASPIDFPRPMASNSPWTPYAWAPRPASRPPAQLQRS